MSTQAVGRKAEAAAQAHLQRHGLSLLQTNYRCRWGEVDLIMRHADAIVFVEVRYRSNARFGDGFTSVNRRKQLKLVRTAQHYLQHNADAETAARIDVVSCAPGASGELKVNWLRNAIEVGA